MARSASQAAAERVAALYGGALPVDGGVVHVASVWRATADRHVVLKIEPDTPKSAADAFALSLSRVRADAILTTGGILRAEPEMRVAPFGAYRESLQALRRDAFGRAEPPALLILTRGELPLSHPALRTWTRPIVVTGRQGAQALRPQLGSNSPIHLVELSVPSAAAAINWARTELGARTVSVEAGPTAALPLYRASPCVVDELMLSVFDDPPPEHIRGKPFVSPQRVAALLPRCAADTAVSEPSGRWRVQRWTRG